VQGGKRVYIIRLGFPSLLLRVSFQSVYVGDKGGGAGDSYPAKRAIAMEHGTPGQVEKPRWRFYLSLYLLVAGFYLLSASGRIGLSDAVAMLNVAESVARDGSFSSDPCEPDVQDLTTGMSVGCVLGSGERHYAGFGLLPSLLVVPAVVCANSISSIAHVNPVVIAKTGVSLFTALVAPLACVVLAMWIVELGYSRRLALYGALILGLGSPYWHFGVKGFYSEPYFTLFLLLAAFLLSCRRIPFACGFSGLAFGLACGARLNGAILFPAFILSIAVAARAHKPSAIRFLRDSLCFSAPFSVCVLLIAWSNYVRFGSPFKTGYHVAFPSTSVLLSMPLFKGLSRILFDGDIGLIVFAPWVIVALIGFRRFAREHPAESAFCGAAFSIYLLFFAKFLHSEGGWVAGPRYLTPILPFAVLATASVLQRLQSAAAWKHRSWDLIGALLVIFVGVAFAIQAVGTLFPDERYYSLMEFYEHKAEKPWWSPSIVLASIDFLGRMSMPKGRAVHTGDFDQLAARQKTESTLAANSAATEQEYLNQLPNPVNMTSPNLMLFKFSVMGVPVAVAGIYLAVVLALAAAGAVGLRRCLAL
jgi:hypothetical protein